MPEVFESSTFSLILAWLCCLPTIMFAVSWIFMTVAKHDGVPWLISAWLGVSILVFTPARYLLWLVLTAESYLVQSFGAAFSGLICALYVPLVFGLLYMIGVGLPLASLGAIFPKDKQFTWGRGIAACIVVPVVGIVASVIFFWALPYAGWTVHWLKAKDIVRATNGPSAFMWRYFTSVGAPIILPGFYDQTPQTPTDEVRCHAAALYLNDARQAYFVKNQYSELYKKLTTKSPQE